MRKTISVFIWSQNLLFCERICCKKKIRLLWSLFYVFFLYPSTASKTVELLILDWTVFVQGFQNNEDFNESYLKRKLIKIFQYNELVLSLNWIHLQYSLMQHSIKNKCVGFVFEEFNEKGYLGYYEEINND